jgi:hypothetical protein
VHIFRVFKPQRPRAFLQIISQLGFFHPENVFLTKILEFVSIPGETSNYLFKHINSCLQKLPTSLKKTMTMFTDNNNADFEGANMKGQNVFTKLTK